MSTDGDNVSSGLRYSSGDNPYARAGDQLYSDSRSWIYGTQIVDQLCQIFYAVDVMMWRRRYQHHLRHSMPQACDVDAHFASG